MLARPAIVLALIHLALFSLGFPAPHGDAGAYWEPAILLATEGRIAGPATQHQDLLYTQGFYSYPPGYFLILGSWVYLFGYSSLSLLAYTHVMHLILMLAIWVFCRRQAGAFASCLAVATIFPLFHHGRPDVTALMFGALAWLTLPRSVTLAGVLLGFAVLNSPGYGGSAAASLGMYCLMVLGWKRAVGLTAISVATFVGVFALVLWWQNAWTIAYYQWTNHIAIRGSELNRMPDLTNSYALKFCVLPLTATLLPLVVVRPKIPILCLLAGFAFWFLTSKAFLLYMGHFGLLARPVYHAATANRRLGIVSALIVATCHAYLEKGDYTVISHPPAYEIPNDAVLATDSTYFADLYRPGRTISYEMFHVLNRWESYRDRTPIDLLSGPLEPDIIILSDEALKKWGPPDSAKYRACQPGVFVRLNHAVK